MSRLIRYSLVRAPRDQNGDRGNSSTLSHGTKSSPNRTHDKPGQGHGRPGRPFERSKRVLLRSPQQERRALKGFPARRLEQRGSIEELLGLIRETNPQVQLSQT